jgi:preprotein translocase subunit YajC
VSTLLLIQAASSGGSPSVMGLPLIVIQLLGFGAVFYFLILRPQNKAKREHRELLSKLKKGDEIMTAGGIIGRVKEMKDVEIGSTTETRVTVESGTSTLVVERGRIIRVGAAGPPGCGAGCGS